LMIWMLAPTEMANQVVGEAWSSTNPKLAIFIMKDLVKTYEEESNLVLPKMKVTILHHRNANPVLGKNLVKSSTRKIDTKVARKFTLLMKKKMYNNWIHRGH